MPTTAAGSVTWFKDAHVQALDCCNLEWDRMRTAAVFCCRFIITGSSGHYTSVVDGVAAVEVSGRIANTTDRARRRMSWLLIEGGLMSRRGRKMSEVELLFFGTVEEHDQSSVNNSIDVGFCSSVNGIVYLLKLKNCGRHVLIGSRVHL